MSIRNDSSLLQRARKNTPDISVATDQGNTLEKDHIMVNVEMGTSPEQKPQTRQQQHRNRLRIYWVTFNRQYNDIIQNAKDNSVIGNFNINGYFFYT